MLRRLYLAYLKMLSRLCLAVENSDGESAKLLMMINKCAHPESRILDVGCGYGRKLNLLLSAGYANTTGVEINAEIVKHNKERGLPCVTVDEFNRSEDKYDIILMSHVDDYLDHLVSGGHLVIATPLMSSYFYDDFDHVKPYQPAGISAVFGVDKAQVQYYSKNKLILKDLWFRKSAYRMSFVRGKYINTPRNKYTNMLAALLFPLPTLLSGFVFFLSNRFLSKTDGWVGVFQKVEKQ
jgi:SAM-dependent methyltransferase